MNKGPVVSVIITASDRREFLMDAVNSVLKQSADRELYEVIVVKNFKDFTIDRFLENHDVVNLFLDSTSGGEKFVAGITRASGEIISFLDDDDLFDENKIEYVIRIFSNGNLGYFHNGMNIRDKEGEPLRISRPGPVKEPLIVRDRLAGNSISLMLQRGAWFNSSSISLRKEIIIPKIDILGKIKAVTDSFLFYATLMTDFTILMDPVRLTYYRVHNSLSNFSGEFENFASAKTYLYRRSLQDFLAITQMLENSPYSEYSLSEASRTKFQLGSVADYPEFRPTIVDFIRFFKMPGHIGLSGAIHLMAAYVVSIFNRGRAVKMLYNIESKRFRAAKS